MREAPARGGVRRQVECRAQAAVALGRDRGDRPRQDAREAVQRRLGRAGLRPEPREADRHPAPDRLARLEAALRAHPEDRLLAPGLKVGNVRPLEVDDRLAVGGGQDQPLEAARPLARVVRRRGVVPWRGVYSIRGAVEGLRFPMDERLRRSLLYVPASSEAMLRKAPSRGADAIIVDLEDGVLPDAKEGARAQAEGLWLELDLGSAEVLLRVNASGTPWHEDDLSVAAKLRPAGLVLPKCEDPAAIAGDRRPARGDAALPDGRDRPRRPGRARARARSSGGRPPLRRRRFARQPPRLSRARRGGDSRGPQRARPRRPRRRGRGLRHAVLRVPRRGRTGAECPARPRARLRRQDLHPPGPGGGGQPRVRADRGRGRTGRQGRRGPRGGGARGPRSGDRGRRDGRGPPRGRGPAHARPRPSGRDVALHLEA